jgi:predicted nucleic acid-binding protein
MVPRALVMANALSHPIYDCIYLALAENEATTLVTADLRFLKAVQSSVWSQLVAAL